MSDIQQTILEEVQGCRNDIQDLRERSIRMEGRLDSLDERSREQHADMKDLEVRTRKVELSISRLWAKWGVLAVIGGGVVSLVVYLIKERK